MNIVQRGPSTSHLATSFRILGLCRSAKPTPRAWRGPQTRKGEAFLGMHAAMPLRHLQPSDAALLQGRSVRLPAGDGLYHTRLRIEQ